MTAQGKWNITYKETTIQILLIRNCERQKTVKHVLSTEKDQERQPRILYPLKNTH
jgi:hypothetical protein